MHRTTRALIRTWTIWPCPPTFSWVIICIQIIQCVTLLGGFQQSIIIIIIIQSFDILQIIISEILNKKGNMHNEMPLEFPHNGKCQQIFFNTDLWICLTLPNLGNHCYTYMLWYIPRNKGYIWSLPYFQS